MITTTTYTCEYCGRTFLNGDACIDHEKECNYCLKFYDSNLNPIVLLKPDTIDRVKYIRVPNYKQYVKLIGVYPNTAVLENTSNCDYPLIICRTTLRKTEWMLLKDYYSEVFGKLK